MKQILMSLFLALCAACAGAVIAALEYLRTLPSVEMNFEFTHTY